MDSNDCRMDGGRGGGGRAGQTQVTVDVVNQAHAETFRMQYETAMDT